MDISHLFQLAGGSCMAAVILLSDFWPYATAMLPCFFMCLCFLWCNILILSVYMYLCFFYNIAALHALHLEVQATQARSGSCFHLPGHLNTRVLGFRVLFGLGFRKFRV